MSELTPRQVQEQTGLSRHELQRLEEAGLVRPRRTPGGHRRYRPEDVARLKTVQLPTAIAQAQEGGNGRRPPPLDELGASGLRRQGSQIWEERLQELRGHQGRILLREMRINDPVIASVFTAVENALLQATWRVKPASDDPADQEVADFVASCLHDMSFSWHTTLQFVLQMLEQGFSLLEITYKRRLGPHNHPPSQHNDGRIGWRKLAPRPAETIVGWEFDENGGLQAAIQELPNGKQVKLPIQRLLLFRTTAAPANSPEGIPIHRAMYLAWWYSQNIAEIEGIGIERDLAGIPVVYLGYDCTLQGSRSDYELAKELVVNLRNDEQTGVVIPKPKLGTAGEGRGMLLELLSTGGRRQYNTSDILNRYDHRKATAVLAQFIMLGVQETGSYALAKSQAELFSLAVSSWLHNIADTFNRHAIPRLLAYNTFPKASGLPKLVPSPISMPDLEAVATFITQLRTAGALTPDPELERHLRQIAHLPEPTGEPQPLPAAGAAQASQQLAQQTAALRRLTLTMRNLIDSGAATPEEAERMFGEPIQRLQQQIAASLGVAPENLPASITQPVP